MKSIIILMVLSLGVFAQSQTTATELLQISQRVQNKIEYDVWNMSPEQRAQVARRLLAVERLLSGQTTTEVACIRHSSSYLGYALTKVSNNQKVSISMALNECQKLLMTQKDSVVCTKTSNSYLGFKAYNLNNDMAYGIGTDFNECSSLVSAHNRGLLCAKMSNSYIGYRLTRLNDGGILGGFYNRFDCLSQLQ
jgi:hypothetical protein